MVRRRLVAVRRNLVAIAIVVPGGSGSSLTAAIKRLGRMRCAARPKDKHQHESADERQETAHSFSLPALPRKGKETLPKRHHRSIVDIGREGSARRAGPPLLVDQRRLRAREGAIGCRSPRVELTMVTHSSTRRAYFEYSGARASQFGWEDVLLTREPPCRSSHWSRLVRTGSGSSNCTGRLVFCCTKIARGRMRAPLTGSSTSTVTRSQSRSLLSIARSKSAGSRRRSCQTVS